MLCNYSRVMSPAKANAVDLYERISSNEDASHGKGATISFTKTKKYSTNPKGTQQWQLFKLQKQLEWFRAGYAAPHHYLVVQSCCKILKLKYQIFLRFPSNVPQCIPQPPTSGTEHSVSQNKGSHWLAVACLAYWQGQGIQFSRLSRGASAERQRQLVDRIKTGSHVFVSASPT